MLKFGETKVAIEEFDVARKPMKIWNVNVDKIVVSKLIETKTITQCIIQNGYNIYEFKN